MCNPELPNILSTCKVHQSQTYIIKYTQTGFYELKAMYTWILKCWLKVYFCSHYSQKAVRFKMETFVKLIQDFFFLKEQTLQISDRQSLFVKGQKQPIHWTATYQLVLVFLEDTDEGPVGQLLTDLCWCFWRILMKDLQDSYSPTCAGVSGGY